MPHGDSFTDMLGSQQMLQLPPQLLQAMEDEYKARFGAAPQDGLAVLTRFFASLTGEYAEDARKAHNALNFRNALRRSSARRQTLTAGLPGSTGQDSRPGLTGVKSALIRTAKKAGMVAAAQKLPTGLEMAGFGFQTLHDTHMGGAESQEVHRVIKHDLKSSVYADESRRSAVVREEDSFRDSLQESSLQRRASFRGSVMSANHFPVGTRVVHTSRGPGLVTQIMEDGRTRVKFDTGAEHRYKPFSMHKLRPEGAPGTSSTRDVSMSPRLGSSPRLGMSRMGSRLQRMSSKRLPLDEKVAPQPQAQESGVIKFKATFEGSVDQFDEETTGPTTRHARKGRRRAQPPDTRVHA